MTAQALTSSSHIPPTYLYTSLHARMHAVQLINPSTSGYYTLASNVPRASYESLKRSEAPDVSPKAVAQDQSPQGSICCVLAPAVQHTIHVKENVGVCDKAVLSAAGAAHLSNEACVLACDLIG
jgi:hypothetical protein